MFPFAARLRPTHLMAVIAVMLLATALVGAADLLVRDRAAALEAVTTAQGNMALGLERDILRNLDIYDLSLRTAASGLPLLDAAMDEAARKAILFDRSPAAQHFRPTVIADRFGTVLHDAGAQTPRIASIANRPFFELHRAHDDLGLLVLLTTHSSMDGRPYLSMTRRVSGTDGSFNGTVSGGLNLDYFRDIFSRFTLPSGGAIALIGFDGRLVAGFPFREDMAGRDVSGAGLVDRARIDAAATFETRSVLDGVTRLATVRRLGELPFFIAIGIPSDAAYAKWRERAWAIGAGMFGFAAMSLLLLNALSRELTKRRMAEQQAIAAGDAVRASERRLGTYVDYLADGFLAIGMRPDGQFVYERVNTAAARMLGVRPQDAIGRRPREVWPGPIADSVEEKWRECLSANAPLNYQREYSGADGKRVLRFVLAPARETLDGGAGPVTLLLATVRDVTDIVALEARLVQAQRLEAVGQLTAGVAHDFNNMLQAQLGALEILVGVVHDHPRAMKYAELALAAGRRGSSLTNSLLSFSRQLHLEPQAVPVDTLLAGLEQILSRTLGPRIELRVQVEQGVAAPLADPAQLESALLNLALNARDAMEDGGIMVIEARGGTMADTAPNGMTAADAVLLAVSDAGTGMTPEAVSKACEPFFTTKGIGKGSGLGLSMVRGFVQQSNGAMQIRSAPGQGTRVELWLPRASNTTPVPREEARGSIAPAGAGRRVLLVDDEVELLAVTAELLEDRGFEVVQAVHGAEALTLMATERAFDVLVTDYMMPGIDGRELISRANRMFPDLPTLLLTGYAESEVLRGLPAHVAVARKPLRGDALAQHVSDVLSRPRDGSGLGREVQAAC